MRAELGDDVTLITPGIRGTVSGDDQEAHLDGFARRASSTARTGSSWEGRSRRGRPRRGGAQSLAGRGARAARSARYASRRAGRVNVAPHLRTSTGSRSDPSARRRARAHPHLRTRRVAAAPRACTLRAGSRARRSKNTGEGRPRSPRCAARAIKARSPSPRRSPCVSLGELELRIRATMRSSSRLRRRAPGSAKLRRRHPLGGRDGRIRRRPGLEHNSAPALGRDASRLGRRGRARWDPLPRRNASPGAPSFDAQGVAGSLSSGSTRDWPDPIERVDLTGPVALVVGAEGKRPSPERDQGFVRPPRARLPMGGPLASLNASVAVAIGLYETVRQRGHGRRAYSDLMRQDAPLMAA